jgi:hypothetical protein
VCKGLQNATDLYIKTWKQCQLDELDQNLGMREVGKVDPSFSGFAKYQKAVLYCSMTSTAHHMSSFYLYYIQVEVSWGTPLLHICIFGERLGVAELFLLSSINVEQNNTQTYYIKERALTFRSNFGLLMKQSLFLGRRSRGGASWKRSV